MKKTQGAPGKAAGDLVMRHVMAADENDRIVKDSLTSQADAFAQRLADRKEKSFNKTKNTYISGKGGSKDESFRHFGGDHNILSDLDTTLDKGRGLYKSKSGRNVPVGSLTERKCPEEETELFRAGSEVSPIRGEPKKTLEQQIIDDARKTATFRTNDPEVDIKGGLQVTADDEYRRDTLGQSSDLKIDVE